jgi:hypothetical protein
LEIDGHFDLLEAVRQREITAHHAGILVGYFGRAPTKSPAGEDPRSKRRLFNEQALLRGIVK